MVDSTHTAGPARPVSSHTLAAGAFVGRERELATLQAGLRAASAGRAGLFLVVGEPGIGKTRLADELTAVARAQGARVLWGRCWEGEGAPPFWPWTQVVRAYRQGREPAAVIAAMGPGAADIAQVIPEIREQSPDLPVPAPLDASQERFRAFTSMTAFLHKAAQNELLVLILDDLHWADEPSILMLHFLAREVRDARLLVVATYRDVELHAGHALATAIGKLTREGQRIDLRGLSESEVSRLVGSAWGAGAPPSLAAALHQRTDGNPFFVTEIIRLLASARGPTDSDRRVPWNADIPHGVRQTIRCRLDRLPEPQRRVLAVAAVIGREFGLDVLARLLDNQAGEEDSALLAALDGGRAAGLIDEMPNTVHRYRFSHALVRETLYEDLPTPQRVQLHGRIGRVLEQLSQTHREPYLAELAHHFSIAAPIGDVDKAVQYCVQAAEQCSRRVAYEDAVRHYQRALQCLELQRAGGEDRRAAPAAAPALRAHCELLLALGQAQSRAGDMVPATDSFKRVAAVARANALADLLGRAAIGAAGRWGVRSGIDPAALALLEEAAAVLGPGATAVHVGVLSRLAMALRLSGAQERSLTTAEDAVARARRLAEPAALAYALDARRSVRWKPEDCEERLAVAAEIDALADQAGDAEMALWNRLSRLIALLELGDMPAVQAEIQAQARLAAALRQPFYLWITVVHRAMQALMIGRWQEAEELITEAHTMGRRVQRETATQIFGVQMFVLRGEQGRLDELADGVRWFVEHYPSAPAWRAGLAHVYSETGRLADARREFDYLAANGFHALPRGPDWLISIVLLAQVCSALGDAARAAELYALLLPYARRNVVLADMAACLGSASRHLAMLAATIGRWPEAARHLEDALEMNTKMAARPYVAHTQYTFARMLAARDRVQDRTEALQRAAAAAAIYEDLGMHSYRDRARALQQGIASTPSGGRGGTAAGARYLFHKEGDYWTISYDGILIRQRDTKGLQYIARLLQQPGHEFHVDDLLLLTEGALPDQAAQETYRTMSAAQLREQGLSVTPGAAHPGAADARAKAEYRHRLEELQREFEAAEGLCDTPRIAKAREEMDFIAAELHTLSAAPSALRSAAAAEKVRKAVGNRMRATLSGMQKTHPSLWQHLFSSIRMGTFCSYRPSQPVAWEF